jgi:hypothetical protein
MRARHARQLGSPGASARREYERRRHAREQRARESRFAIVRLLRSLQDPPAHELSWERGAAGEETVATSLGRRCRGHVVLLHDRRIPGRRMNIDHLAVAPSGVWVIDTKRYKGRVEVAKPLFGKPTLKIRGCDKTPLVRAVTRQVAAVETVVAGAAPVKGVLCFVDGELPLLGTLTIDGLALVYPRALAKRLNAAGPVGANAIDELAARLAARFPSA